MSNILNLINEGSYAAAGSALRRQLQSHPNASIYHVLNNLLVHKLGNPTLAMSNNLALLAKTPNDPQTVQLLNEYFLENDRPKEASQAYENVARKYPTLESTKDLLQEWMSKTYDIKTCHKIATLLSKTTSQNRRYKLWVVFYYLEMSMNTAVPKEELLYRTLGLRTLEGLLPLKTPHELYLLCRFYETEKKYDKILETLSNTDTKDLDLQLIHVNALKETESWDALKTYTEGLLVGKFNDFDTWKLYITACYRKGDSFKDVMAFIEKFSNRNSKLAAVEASFVYEEDYDNALVKYFISMSGKLCVYDDLRGYLLARKSIAFEKYINEGISKDSIAPSDDAKTESSKDTSKRLIKLINVQKFTYLTTPKSPELTSSLIQSSWNIYHRYSSNTTSDFDSNPVNQLPLIAMVLDLSIDLSIAKVIKYIIILTHLLKGDPHNHTITLWLLKLHSHLPTSNYLMFYYKQMKVKMIQNDTLSHFVWTLNPSKSHLADLVKIYRFYMTGEDEIRGAITEGLNSEVYNKLYSFINFERRLKWSISRVYLVIKIIQMSVILGDMGYVEYFVNALKELATDRNEFYDNRDFKTEWKGLPFESFALDGPAFTEEYIRGEVQRYLVIFGDSNVELLSNLDSNKNNGAAENTAYSHVTSLYISLIQLFTKPTPALKSSILKNISLPTLNQYLTSQNWTLNYNLTLFAEFGKVAPLLFRKYSAEKTQKEVLNSIAQMSKNLKKFKFDISKVKVKVDEIEIAGADEIFKDLLDSSNESRIVW